MLYLVRPVGFEPPTALRSGAHVGYKPTALPIELRARSFGLGGRLCSCALPLPKRALCSLSYTQMATCRGFDPRSSARQADRHTSSVAGREMVSAGRLERPLSALSTRSLCRLGYADEMEDHRGHDPRTCRLRAGRSAD